jgi:hypothetical protein
MMIDLMISKQLRQFVLPVAVFFMLIVCGNSALATESGQPSTLEEKVTKHLDHLTEQLVLTEDQQIQIKPLLEGMITEIDALRGTGEERGRQSSETRETRRSIRDRYHQLIEAELTDAQQEQYRELLETEKSQQRQRRQGRGNERGGGKRGRGGPGRG